MKVTRFKSKRSRKAGRAAAKPAKAPAAPAKAEAKASAQAAAVKEAAEAAPKQKKERKPLRIKLIPRFYVRWLERQLSFAGSARDPAKFARNVFIASLLAAVLAGLFMRRLMWILSPSAFILTFGFFNLMVILSVDRRGRFVDEILPDSLMLLSANIRAGYIPSRALVLSARKEFGPLADAIKQAGNEIMSGKSLEEGMMMIPKAIKSKDLKRTIELIVQGIKGGGQIVTLLEENAVDIRRRQAITKEIKANTMMYAIFIAFAGCLGAPGLYALSSYLVTTMAQLTPDVSMTNIVSNKVSFLKMSGVTISPDFLLQFSVAAILLTTIFGGMILGLIGSGREKEGLKYAPILSIIALLVFFGAKFVVSTMFGSMLPG